MVIEEVNFFSREPLPMKSTKELKYIYSLFRVEYKTTRRWSSMILDTIKRRNLEREHKYDGNYKPMYFNFTDHEMEMQRNYVVFETFLNPRKLSFSPDSKNVKDSYILLDYLEILRSPILNLRAAI